MVRLSSLPFWGSAGKGQSIRVSVIPLLFSILLSQSIVRVTADIIDLGMDMIIDASSDEVHFIRGFLRAPASIDLSNIRWITNEAIVFEFGEDDALPGDFDDDASHYATQPTFADSKTETPVAEPIENEDFAGSEGSKDEDNNDGDVIEKENVEDEGVVISFNSTISPEDEQNESEDVVNAESEFVSEPPIPLIESGTENLGEDSLDKSAEEGTKEAGTNDNYIDSQKDGDVQGEEGEFIDKDEENENDDKNPEEAAPDNTYVEDNGKKDEVDESENNADVSDEDDGNGSTEVNGDIGNNGNEGDEGGRPTMEISSEDKNPMGGAVTEEENNKGEELSLDNQSSQGDSDVSDKAGEDTDNNGNGGDEPAQDLPSEDQNQMGDEEDGETETEEEDNDGQELSSETPLVANDSNEGEKADEEMNDTKDEDNGGEQLSIDDRNGDASITEIEEPTSNPSLEAGGDRSLQDKNGDISDTLNQVVDIAMFLIPENCEKDHWGNCDWVTLGVGSYDDEMEQGMSYCCSKDTSFRGICKSNDIGTLMIDEKKFEGIQRKIQVPSRPLEEFKMDDPVFDVHVSGDYVLVIANCNDDGFGIITLGTMEWKSVGGYLPGEIFYMMFVYGAATAIFLVLGLWYYIGMRMFQEAAIPIQKYILASIILGFLGTAFFAIDLLFWNINGTRSVVVMYIAFAMQILFQGLLRCLGVMVAMGWGVVRDTLGMELCKIIMLGLLYSGLSLLLYTLSAAASSPQLVSSARKEELVDIELVLSYVIVCINIIFYCWIISSVKSTTEYLRNMNQTSKLRRHLRLRCLIIVSLIIISSLAAVNIVQALASKINQIDDIKIFKPDNLWIMEAVKYGNYLLILFGVSILWRPNADAKDYAMQMQIPATEGDENDLELSCVVPSADDMDIGEGYKIDDAVAT